ncbi:magnesium protoporphyrin IX methyltransferase [Tabrizicola sp. M-4]|uniref:magnesium protoporphyrin IX methyltransferase n=1 Tax=Tabrizicola sp. M-4 TaxID=3055847 RepID=UPI003DA93F32
MQDYSATLSRVEDYFDRSATKVWERLTSDAPVSRIRQTVREGRDRMRAIMLSRLPADLRGCRVLDAGCGTGLMTAELAARGADVVAVDISPQLIAIAEQRLTEDLRPRVTFASGDMTCASHGRFDFVMAMDSLIYYRTPDIAQALRKLADRTSGHITFTVAPRTPFLMTFFTIGKAFPRADRSPTMIPQDWRAIARHTGGDLAKVERVSRGFYISECLEYRA